MDNTINSDLIRGHINTIILKALYDGDRYGYDIIKDIEQKSSGQYTLKQPTLYSCLKRLESQGFISSYWGAKSNGGRRKYYTLTDMGRELFLKNQTDWEYSRTVIDRLISDKTFDLATVPPLPDTGDLAVKDGVSDMTDEEIERQFNEDRPSEEEQAENESVADAVITEQQSPVPTEEPAQRILREAMDTAELMNLLFEQKIRDSGDASYTESLAAEPVVAQPAPSSADYFRDFPVEDESETSTPVPQPTYDDQAPAKTIADILADSPPTPYTPFYYRPDEPETVEEPQAAEQPQSSDDGFLRYDSDVAAADEDALVIHREYKNILGDLFQPSAPAPEPVEQPAPAPEPSEDDKARQKSFSRLENNMKDLGDGITIRTHNSAAAKQYTSEHYYYSNKLMLYHYGILFGVTVLEMVILFLFIRVGLGIKQVVGNFQVDLLLYGLAILGTLVFPIVAAVRYFREPDHRKRVNFSLKSSMVFRISLAVVCAILVYLVNLFCHMSVASISGYVPSLFIPWILCLNFPISSLIFFSLFSSNKFMCA